MKISKSIFANLIEMVLDRKIRKATKYLSPTSVVKATFQGKRDLRDKTQTIVVTLGRPNYAERKYIRLLKEANEPFPVKKIKMTFYKFT